MRKILVISFILFSIVRPDTAYQFNKLASLPGGIRAAYSPVGVGDTDHDGANEIVFYEYNANLKKMANQIYEYRPGNVYEPVVVQTENNFYFGGIGCVDKDSLTDIAGTQKRDMWYVQTYESPTYLDYPTRLSWEKARRSPTTVIYTNLITDFDKDGWNEIWTGIDANLTYIVEVYENSSNNYNLLVSSETTGALTNFPCGDFDRNGKNDFVAWGTINGRPGTVVFENTGNDQYQEAWRDDNPPKNGFDLFSGNDCDGDGKPEFFGNYDQPVGMHRFMAYLMQYEAVGNHLYRRVCLDSFYHTGVFIASQSCCGDVDGDGREEIVWSLGTDVVVLKAAGDDRYERVWQWHNDLGADIHESVRAVCFDLNKNGYDEIILSGEGETEIWEIDKASILEAKNSLGKPLVSFFYPPCPNPFRDQTTIRFQIAGDVQQSQLRIFDAAGRSVKSFHLTNNHSPVAGVTWDGRDDFGGILSAGVYFCELSATQYGKTSRWTKKLILER